MDSIFLFSLLFIFISALIGTVLKARTTDKCLSSFEDYHVTLEQNDGNLIWGKMLVYSTGLELEYAEPVKDREGHMESSYILYREQFNEIQAIYRYYDELSEENKEKRKETIRQTLHPTLFQKHSRDLKNFANTFRDALMQAIGVAIGQMKKSHPGSMILKAHEQEISDMSKEFIGYVGTAFDPILERHIGRKVVLEIAKNGKITEYPGVLREYSANFLEVLNVKKAMQNTFTIRLDEEKKIPGKIRVTFTEGQIAIENKGENPVFIKEVQTAEKVHELNVVAQPETIADFPLDVPAKEVCIVVEIAKDMDIVVPRVHALIRHSSETKTPKIELEILRKLPVKK